MKDLPNNENLVNENEKLEQNLSNQTISDHEEKDYENQGRNEKIINTRKQIDEIFQKIVHYRKVY